MCSAPMGNPTTCASWSIRERTGRPSARGCWKNYKSSGTMPVRVMPSEGSAGRARSSSSPVGGATRSCCWLATTSMRCRRSAEASPSPAITSTIPSAADGTATGFVHCADLDAPSRSQGNFVYLCYLDYNAADSVNYADWLAFRDRLPPFGANTRGTRGRRRIWRMLDGHGGHDFDSPRARGRVLPNQRLCSDFTRFPHAGRSRLHRAWPDGRLAGDWHMHADRARRSVPRRAEPRP